MSDAKGAGTATVRVWDPWLRFFHWSLVAAVGLAFASAFEGSPLAPSHQTAGWCAAVLIAFRLVWGFVGGEHARFADFVRPNRIGEHVRELLSGRAQPSLGHNPLGALAVIALLALSLLVIATGAASPAGAENEAHEALAYGLLALAGVHILAVAAMSAASGENLVRAMISGRKAAAKHPGALDARTPPATALVLALIAAAAAAWGATRVDANAFGPHPAVRESEDDEGREATAQPPQLPAREAGRD